MQAFIYKHLVLTNELLLTVIQTLCFALSADIEPPSILDVRQVGNVKVVVKALCKDTATGLISLTVDEPPKGINVRRAVIAKDKDEVTVTISVTKQSRRF